MVDCWTADTTKAGFVGITAHWIRVMKSGEWKLEGNMIALRGLVGEHGGKNLGCYVAGLCDRVGITGFRNSKVSNHVITANHDKIDLTIGRVPPCLAAKAVWRNT